MSQIREEHPGLTVPVSGPGEAMDDHLSRREFLQIMGLCGLGSALAGCDVATTVTLEEGKESIASYLSPDEYVIPGVGNWFASTCLQCPAQCALHGRVREGRVLKLEGNPESQLNHGKLCQMGQAGLQNHFNPDRILNPMVRQGGRLMETDWDSALKTISEHLNPLSQLDKNQVAWVTGTVSGHQRVLIENHLGALDSNLHFLHEPVNSTVWQQACESLIGTQTPTLHLDRASLILSFGADFLGTWDSPVHYAHQYSAFRSLPDRGSLIQIESKMSLTGANADLWIPIRPGGEGVLAMGLARMLLESRFVRHPSLPPSLYREIMRYGPDLVSQKTGVSHDQLNRLSRALVTRTPSLILAGPSVGGHRDGFDATAAVMMLNLLLDNVGKTITPKAQFPYPGLIPKRGNTHDLVTLSQALKADQIKTLFICGSNPIFTSPAALGIREALEFGETFKVAITSFPDETAMIADVILPAASYLEDWGTHVPSHGPNRSRISLQQPLMERWKGSAKGVGDTLLELLKMVAPEHYSHFPDYYGYLQQAIGTLYHELPKTNIDRAEFWSQALQFGGIDLEGEERAFTFTPSWPTITLEGGDEVADRPYYLLPSPRVGLFDGRHANLPWLQESPDPITRVVWDSWAEIHPKTARSNDITHGEVIEIDSGERKIRVKAYLTKAVHPDVVAVPLGQGHTDYGRFAQGVGANPLPLLNPIIERQTGELAIYATRISIRRIGQEGPLVRMGGSDFQHDRGLARTITSAQAKRSEGS